MEISREEGLDGLGKSWRKSCGYAEWEGRGAVAADADEKKKIENEIQICFTITAISLRISASDL